MVGSNLGDVRKKEQGGRMGEEADLHKREGG